MSLYNSLITKLRASSLTVNEQSCLRGRRVYGWEVRSGNMCCSTWWEFAVTALKSSSSVSCTRCDTERCTDWAWLLEALKQQHSESANYAKATAVTRCDKWHWVIFTFWITLSLRPKTETKRLKVVRQRTCFISTNERLMYKYSENYNYFTFIKKNFVISIFSAKNRTTTEVLF